MLLDLLAYGAVLGLSHSVHFYRRYREREHRALVLESNLANARLQALRAQLQPHFLFNSLNAVATLLRRDVRLAEATLMSLSELLRLALTQSEKQEVSLREELAFVQRYLEIQQTRFGEKLRVEQDIDPAALDCLVPTLVLQPLIENAIRHGIEPSESAGLVRLSATKTDGKLVLAVEDDGVGLSPLPLDTRHSTPLTPRGTGIGLTNLRARLVALYGTEQKLELVTRPEGGVRVLIEIPWRLAVTLETAPANNN
jgi:sensor histidine kinase YesM